MALKRLLSLPVIAIMLPGGCVSGDDAVPNVQYKPVLVDHPVPCVPADQKPTPPAPLGPKPDDARQGEAMLLAKVQELFGYVDHAQPLLDACTRVQ